MSAFDSSKESVRPAEGSFGGQDRPQNLKNWDVEDFSLFFLENRDDLFKFARSLVSDVNLAEELVQDATLYVMTSLPELDSREGLIKFLKWKIRNLSVDYFRSQARKRESGLDEVENSIIVGSELDSELERAEDLAVIRNALSKISPRQREILLETSLGDKTREEIAVEQGLSDNAARQLLWRARHAFKLALVGEAQIAGKSAGEILSIAARKTSAEARKLAAGASVFALLLAGSMTLLSNQNRQLDSDLSNVVAASPNSVSGSIESNDSVPKDSLQFMAPVEDEGSSDSNEDRTAQEETFDVPIASEQQGGEDQIAESSETVSSDKSQRLSEDVFSEILSTNAASAGFYSGSEADFSMTNFLGSSIEVFGGTGASVYLDINFDTLEIHQAVFVLTTDSGKFYAIARTLTTTQVESPSERKIQLAASEFFLVDESRSVIDDSPLFTSQAKISVILDREGLPTSASMRWDKS